MIQCGAYCWQYGQLSPRQYEFNSYKDSSSEIVAASDDINACLYLMVFCRV